MEESTTVVQLNWVDAATLGAIVLGLIAGLMSGFFTQFAGLLCLAAGLAATMLAGEVAAQVLGQWVAQPSVARFLADLVLFVAAATLMRLGLLAVNLLFRKEHRVTGADTLSGAVFGAIKAVLLCAILIVFAGSGDVPVLSTAVQSSYSGSAVLAVTGALSDWADRSDVHPPTPEEAEAMLERLRRQVEEGLQEEGAESEDGEEDEAPDDESTDGPVLPPSGYEEP